MCSKFKINYFSPIMKKPFKQNYCFQEAKVLQNGTLGVKKNHSASIAICRYFLPGKKSVMKHF